MTEPLPSIPKPFFRERVSSLVGTLSSFASTFTLVCSGLAILGGGLFLQTWVRNSADALTSTLKEVRESRTKLSETVGEYRSLTQLRSHDIAQLHSDLSNLTKSRRAMFESTFDIQEEQRLLDKQWEIMSTYLMIDEQAKKIHLMRGEQALESYPINTVPPRVVGSESGRLPPILHVASKERFAHPERGSYEDVNGQLVWNPPQIGTSIRANALGEYVTFTSSPLILHGPPKHPEEHEAFSHYCLDLSLATAEKLFKNSFIGTKIIIKGTAEQKQPPETASGTAQTMKP